MTTATRDLPQASSLSNVRELVGAIAAGHDRDLRDAGMAVGLSERHAAYYGLSATITLGLAAREGLRFRVTPLGAELLATRPGSLTERSALRRAIADSPSVTSIAPDLIDVDGPTIEALTERMIHAGLSRKTARRRASTLLSWRRYVLDRQGTLDLVYSNEPVRRAATRRGR
jgi:hypothetical protein